MILLLGMPSGPEWTIIIVLIALFLIFPIMAVYFFSKSRRLMKELNEANKEKSELLKRLLDQK